MVIGVPKEIKNNESRVGMTPSGVFELVKNNHTIYVQSTAGEGSGFFDEDYSDAGARILPNIEETDCFYLFSFCVQGAIDQSHDQ